MANVTGPTSSTDTAIARWNGTTGTVIQDSTVTVDGSGNISGVAAINNGATATTQSQGDNSTKIATTAYVDTGLSDLSLNNLTDVTYQTGGPDNLIIGQKVALASGATQNVFIGELAGATAANSTSATTNNTAVGYNSMSTLTSGTSNTSLGNKALGSITNGNYNTAIGDNALPKSTGARSNTAVGESALFNHITGDQNSAFGVGALSSSTGGTQNIGVGYNAGATITTGSYNTLLGYTADVSSDASVNRMALGNGAIASADNTVQIGNSSVTAVYFGASGTTLGTDLALAGNPTTTTQSLGDNSTKIATTAYVDTTVAAITAGLDARSSCRVATTAALTATYNNGSSGVGATLTNSGTQVAISIDGVSLASGDRVLVKNQSTAAQNGIYTVTTVGSGSTNWVLTRATDFNTASSTGVVEGAYTVIEEGTTQFGTFWIETGAGPFTIGTTAITFTQLQVTNVNLTNGHILVGNASNVASDVAMSGDVTISNTGAATIANNAVSNAKFRQSAGLSVVGTTGSSTANVADITGTANQVLVVNSGGTALSFGKVNLTSAAGVTGTLPLANIATISNNTILGNNSGGTASPSALTAAQTKTLLAIANTDVSGLGTMSTQNASSVAITGGSITGMSTPTNGSDVATKSYVDASTAGLSAHSSCRVATTAALTATYNNGSSGVGATLTNSGAKSAISIDGVSLAVNDRVLVMDQSTAAQNGIYTVTTVGSGSVNWVLTRATDFNTASSNGIVEGAYTVIEEGTANAGTLWIETGQGPFTVGTTAISFTELSVAPQTITFTGDVTGTGSGSIALSIGAGKVTNSMLAGSIAASKLVGTDIATVGTITSGTWNGTAIIGTYIASSVALAGSPTTTTQSAGDNSTKIATTAYVDAAVATGGVPTFQYLTSGTSATYTTPANCQKIVVEMVGGGGGGGGTQNSAGGGNGGTGGDTIFNSVHAAGGSGCSVGGVGGNNQGGAGGSGGSGSATHRIAGCYGGNGSPGASASPNGTGGNGGNSYFGGAGAGQSITIANNATVGAGNSGSGGGGAATSNLGIGGGGAGEYVILEIASPSSTYSYTIGAGGAAGSSTGSGHAAAGGSGFIKVTEYY